MGKPAGRAGDMHICPKVDPGPKPHVGGLTVSGSNNVLINAKPALRVGDKAICIGPVDIPITNRFPCKLHALFAPHG